MNYMILKNLCFPWAMNSETVASSRTRLLSIWRETSVSEEQNFKILPNFNSFEFNLKNCC